MIRPANFPDIEAVKVLIREMYDVSKYRGHVDISEKMMNEVLLAALASQRSPLQSGSSFQVAENARGEVIGFMIGLLDRIYHIGNRLVGQDMFLHVSPRGKAGHSLGLVRAYVKWAESNPRLLVTKLSWEDTLPGAEAVARLYAKLGFRRCGEIWERWNEPAEMRAAA